MDNDILTHHLSATVDASDNTLSVAVLIATALHAFVIFGIGFGMGKMPADLVADVASVLSDDKFINENARFVANASQEGGGQVRQQLRLETTNISPDNADDMEEIQDIINIQKQVRQQNYQQSYLRTTLSIRHTTTESDNKSYKEQNDLQAQEERVRKKIQTLEAQLSQKQQVFASKTKIETVDSNATTHGRAAAYLENFRTHVERVANQYYPKKARDGGITGDVRLMVVINQDGTVKMIHLLESSGSVVLDEAAKQSVRQSAPYGKFTEEMGDMVELRVVRTWRYSESLEVAY